MPKNEQIFTEAELQTASKAAYVYTKKAPSQREDMEQELLYWMYKHPDRVIGYREPGKEGLFWYKLGQVAQNVYRKNRESNAVRAEKKRLAEQDGQIFTKESIKNALPYVFADGNLNMSGELYARLSEIGRAYGDLSREDQRLLTARYKYGFTNQKIGDDGVGRNGVAFSEGTARHRIDVAIDRLRSRIIYGQD